MTGTARIALGVLAALLLTVACTPGEEVAVDDTEIRIGPQIVDGVIRLGLLSPLTGPAALMGEPRTTGHRVYFEHVNEDLGGVGRNLPEESRFSVELLVRDTQAAADVHTEQYDAIRDDVLAVSQSHGIETTRAILPRAADDSLLIGATPLLSEWLAEPYVVMAGAPYAIQIINAAHHLAEEADGTPVVGLIHAEDAYGLEGARGLEHAADELGFEIAARATYGRGETEFTPHVQAMRRAGADHVFLAAEPTAASRIWSTAAATGYAPRWIAQSGTWLREVFASPTLADYLEQTVWWVSDATCNWGAVGEGCEGMARMLEHIERFAPDQEPDVHFQLGYTQAKIFHEILERAVARGDLTRGGVRDAFTSLEDVHMDGLLAPVSYGTDCRERVPVTMSGIFAVDRRAPTRVRLFAAVDSPAVERYAVC